MRRPSRSPAVLRAALAAAVLAVLAVPGAASAAEAGAAFAPARSPAFGPSPDGHGPGKPPGVQVVPNVTYRQVDGVTLGLDVYRPTRHGPYPAVLVVHGGGWRYGDKSEVAGEANALAEDGFVAFAANYRLAPPSGIWHAVAPVEDLRAAAVWIREHAGEYDADAARVGGLGLSAGGNLVMMLGTTGTPGYDRLDAVVSWSGPLDLPLMWVCGSACYPRVVNYVGCRYEDCPSNWLAASPVDQVGPGDAPAYLANGTDEVIPLAQAVGMADALAAAGVPYELQEVPGTEHAQAYEDQVIGGSESFLHQYLNS